MKGLIKKLKHILIPPVNIVIDTNLFVAAYWDKVCASARIIHSVQEDTVRMLYTRSIKKEVFLILNNIKVKKQYLDYVEEAFSKGRFIKPKKHVLAVKDDPHDNKYLDCAIYGKAKFIITNDKHLLRLGNYGSIRIVRPVEFIIP